MDTKSNLNNNLSDIICNKDLVVENNILKMQLEEADKKNPLFNSLSANPTKWLNILKQFVGCCRRIVRVCLTILCGWHLKG